MTVQTYVEQLVTDEVLHQKDALFKEQFLELFPPNVPDVAELPKDVLINIKQRQDQTNGRLRVFVLKEILRGMENTNRTALERWPFIVPKADPTVLPLIDLHSSFAVVHTNSHFACLNLPSKKSPPHSKNSKTMKLYDLPFLLQSTLASKKKLSYTLTRHIVKEAEGLGLE